MNFFQLIICENFVIAIKRVKHYSAKEPLFLKDLTRISTRRAQPWHRWCGSHWDYVLLTAANPPFEAPQYTFHREGLCPDFLQGCLRCVVKRLPGEGSPVPVHANITSVCARRSRGWWVSWRLMMQELGILVSFLLAQTQLQTLKKEWFVLARIFRNILQKGLTEESNPHYGV